MKLKNILWCLLATASLCTSCNDEWKDEQYANYISFKAPINSEGVSRINVRYKPNNEVTTFQLPVIVSGSSTNDQNITVHVGLDPDTLTVLNYERFNNREDLYYKVLPDNFYSCAKTMQINTGQDVGLMPIDFKLKGIDLSEKWVLPLTIEEAPDGSYVPNYRKHYRKALLRVMPFNDYSGNYSAVNYKTYLNGSENDAPYVKNYVMMYVVDDETLFFYAGLFDETRLDRKGYKVLAKFNKDNGTVELSPADPSNEMEFAIGEDNFGNQITASYSITKSMDAIRPYLRHQTIIINNINYTFTDYTTIPGQRTTFHVMGSLTLERQINTQIPDEDQAIEWEAGE